MGQRKLRIADVARATGLYRGTISLLYDETAAKIDLETIDKLCAFFGVSVGELLEHVEPKPAPPGAGDRQIPGGSKT
jgi:putative transcriptional regulator